MPVKPLPPNPDLKHLKYQAKDLLKEHAARSVAAAQRIREFHPRWAKASDAAIFEAKMTLSDAQLTIARERGYPSWAKLKRRVENPTSAEQLNRPHHERIEDAVFRRAVELIDAGDVEALREHLKRNPRVVRERVVFEGGNYFRNPTLLEFIAENPVRHGKLPKNITVITQVILDAGVEPAALHETLMLVATGRVPRECGVQGALIDLLCDRGANPDSAVQGAAVLFELEAVRALLARGARMDLPVATALGDVDEAGRLLAKSDAEKRQLALALASQYGRVEVLRLLLDAGEDPNRFNPVGAHSHSTPLHQAASGGHLAAVKLLVERGARTDVRDILFGGTPAGWANHEGKKEVEEYLLSVETNRPEEKLR